MKWYKTSLWDIIISLYFISTTRFIIIIYCLYYACIWVQINFTRTNWIKL